MATLTDSDHGNLQPVCQNCSTSTTPLWRRDEIGSVLCNACGLFLKLHGRNRPLALKTDVIKSRNRVKSAGQSQKKKPLFDGNGRPASRSEAGSPPPNHPNHRRVSQKSASGESDRSNSPISRTATPALQHPPNIAPQHMFDHASLTDQPFNHSPSLPAMHLRHPSPGSTISLNDRHLEPPPTYDVLQQQNTTLKTRVSELEVINNLFRDRVHELEQNDRRAQMVQDQLRQALDHSKQQENELKRRIDDLERDYADLRDMDSPPHAKRPRMSDVSEYPDPPQPLTAAI
ncbi:hypothetical protein MMC11_003556 [Xylographa trunciseda]|nr:hypothetical protein [Xylographa trunciseda]